MGLPNRNSSGPWASSYASCIRATRSASTSTARSSTAASAPRTFATPPAPAHLLPQPQRQNFQDPTFVASSTPRTTPSPPQKDQRIDCRLQRSRLRWGGGYLPIGEIVKHNYKSLKLVAVPPIGILILTLVLPGLPHKSDSDHRILINPTYSDSTEI
jgi:hypothetical protein